MKEYKKQYEDVFTSERSLKHCNLEYVEPESFSLSEYIDLYRDTAVKSFIAMYDMTVQLVWLANKFKYAGYKRDVASANNIYTDKAFSLFMRQYVGVDFRFISKLFFFTKLVSYFKDFYPQFDLDSPFENPDKYKFPYSHVTPDYLMVVYSMPERLELLAIAEDRMMNFNEFLDYVINYIMSYNDEHGKEVYTFILSRICQPYVRNNLKLRKRKDRIYATS